MKRLFIVKNNNPAKAYGLMTFNGKFTFRLNSDVDLDIWNRVGFIPLNSSRYIESADLFKHLNDRLPITLRSSSSEDKINYIKETGLRVASDGFYLEEVDVQEEFAL